jgi:hypothetical protein
MSNPGAWCLNNNALATPQPRWRQDGQEIFYLAPYGFQMSAPVHVSGSAIDVGAVRPLFWLTTLPPTPTTTLPRPGTSNSAWDTTTAVPSSMPTPRSVSGFDLNLSRAYSGQGSS